MHLGLIAITGILATAGMIAQWFRLASDIVWSTFVSFSVITAMVFLILANASSIAAKSIYLGLVERFMVSIYQNYYFVLALMVFLTNSSPPKKKKKNFSLSFCYSSSKVDD